MRMTTLKTSDSNISTLLQRLYPNLSESKLKQADMALLKANPHLTEAGDFRPGVVVTLPSDTGPAEACGNDQCLPKRVGVPRRSCPGLEGDAGASHAGRVWRVDNRVDAYCTGEILRRPFAGRL